ncbi:MAG: nascent polypeptide-associated complex subunit alpha [archaeon GW2011_AR17]|nr:MAG: nascent polypeptide-associated complex subunit alpha [archaeon GW2011_AR17]MBS3154471.1 nascent polypeptide-associated complex protein [Candidatus Woesearchaeota archaeon]HIH15118.1 nascent polypeptide-associated complex protein [Nanoarchaeota archaeon]HIH59394.1 nascent polypeptide-associated complex protein [Nanoarchaeota archaeon]HII14518.1 nascent polypeptide-associated complex protein [Nanoarchaeota archaeon]
MFQGMDPRLVKQAMKKMGMKQEDIPATEVIIKTPEKQFIIKNPHVAKVTMMGEESFQITGECEEASVISEEDIQTVMEQASCSKEAAKRALEKSKGDLAQAILDVQQ